MTHLMFEIPESSAPHFRLQDLQQGHFLCVKHANVFVINDYMHFILVKDADSVRVLKA